MKRSFALFALFFSLLLPEKAQSDTVTVFAAASLRGALEEIAENHDGKVALSFGGSGTMARQVAQGAPADVVVLANTLWMKWLTEKVPQRGADPINIAGNALVLIGSEGASQLESLADLPDRLGNARLAMGQRDAVPAGRYARQWLEQDGLWPDVENALAETDNVRAALALVARGDTPFGIVYASDAAADDRVKVIWHADSKKHDPIVYPALALNDVGEAFLSQLSSPDAKKIFAAHGFAPVHE